MNSILVVFISMFLCSSSYNSEKSGIIYRNPRVYNVEYSFKMFPDPNKIDRIKDLKLWIPIPREWDFQKSVTIISVEPEPHAKYVDPEYGNPMLFWDFGKVQEKPSYKVNIKYRLEQYEVYADVDPNRIGPYDKNSKDYILYTHSTHTISITDKVKELAKIAVGDEKNPYLQAKRIFELVRKKMRYQGGGRLRRERGNGVEDILNFPVIDQETGEECYKGDCHDYSTFFVALCRAVGIPANTVLAMEYWRPWIKLEDFEPDNKFPSLSPDGLAAVRGRGALSAHAWVEIYLPNYGWIPVDPQKGRFGQLGNYGFIIISKGRDIKVGPYTPQKQNEGYGMNYVLLHKGSVDRLGAGVWNITKIHKAQITMLNHPDPFPAHAFAEYVAKFYPEIKAEENLSSYRNRVLTWIDRNTREHKDNTAALAQAYKKEPKAHYEHEAFICHMLRKLVGDKKFSDIFETYADLRVKSGEPVSIARFQKIAEDIYCKQLDWFFKQWIGYTELPQLKLDAVTLSKEEKGWCVRGNLRQLNSKSFRLPMDLVLETEGPTERKKIWMEPKNSNFEFSTNNRPKRLLVDPNNDILQIRKMPPLLNDFWNVYPNLVVVYGTIVESEANKAAAERFNKEYLSLDPNIIKADIDVNEADLNTKCIILFGRPKANKVTEMFKDIFPIRFDGAKFGWQGTTYDKPTQGLAQVAENPNNPRVLVILYAGLSGEATQQFCDLYLYDLAASYVVFDGDKKVLSGNWPVLDDLAWKFAEDKSGHKS